MNVLNETDSLLWAIHSWICNRECDIADDNLSKMDCECMLPRAKGMMGFLKKQQDGIGLQEMFSGLQRLINHFEEQK